MTTQQQPSIRGTVTATTTSIANNIEAASEADADDVNVAGDVSRNDSDANDDDDDDDDNDDRSVTFSVVWEEIVVGKEKIPQQQQQHHPLSTSSTVTALVETNTECDSCDEQQPPPPIIVSRSSSFSSTDIPFRSLDSSNHGSSVNEENHNTNNTVTRRTMLMTGDSRSQESMSVLYHQNQSSSSRIRDSNSIQNVVPATVTIGNSNNSASRVEDGNGDDESVVSSSRMTRLQRVCRICGWTIRLLCFPIWLLVSVFTVSSVIAFCILPGILFVSILISCYYCCSRDPIPFNILMHALFLDDENNPHQNDANNAPTRTKEEIRDLLICRTCTVVEARGTFRSNTDTTMQIACTKATSHQPNHTEIASNRPMCVATEHYSLQFSAPIVHQKSDPLDDSNVVVENENENQWTLYFNNTDVEGSNDERGRSVDAVRAFSTGSHLDSNDDDEVLVDDDDVDDYIRRDDDIEQGTMSSAIEMTTITPARISSEMSPPIEQHDDDIMDDEYESGIGCDICLRRYQVNDVVAWSNNDQCIHAYHLHCITDWLQKKITCPNCRCSYIPGHSNHDKRSVVPRRTPQQQDRGTTNRNDNRSNNTVTGPATMTTTTTPTRNGVLNSSTAGRTSALLMHQRNIDEFHP